MKRNLFLSAIAGQRIHMMCAPFLHPICLMFSTLGPAFSGMYQTYAHSKRQIIHPPKVELKKDDVSPSYFSYHPNPSSSH
jgi:hypothetical protein